MKSGKFASVLLLTFLLSLNGCGFLPGEEPGENESDVTSGPTPTPEPVAGVLTIAQGGTGADTAEGARANLGLGRAVLLDQSGKLPAVDGSQLSDVVAEILSPAAVESLGLKGGARLDAGTGANQLVQLDGSKRLPPVDGSQLFNVTAGALTAAAQDDVKNGLGLKTGAFAEVGTGPGQIPPLDGKGYLPPAAVVPFAMGGVVRGLKVGNAGASSSAVRVEFQAMALEDSSTGHVFVARPSSPLAADISQPGDREGGLANDWWHLYVVSNGTLTGTRAFFSREVRPTLSGYPYWAYVTTLHYNNGFRRFLQAGKKVFFSALGGSATCAIDPGDGAENDCGVYPNPTLISLSTQVPPNALSVDVMLYCYPIATSFLSCYVHTQSTGGAYLYARARYESATGEYVQDTNSSEVPLFDAQKLYVSLSANNPAAAALYVRGYTVP